jgi:hypothetical protein
MISYAVETIYAELGTLRRKRQGSVGAGVAGETGKERFRAQVRSKTEFWNEKKKVSSLKCFLLVIKIGYFKYNK